MSAFRRISSVAASLAISATLGHAQLVTSAHSGTVHYTEGDVTVDGKAVQTKVGRFEEMKEKSILHTALGRAEILLTPGVFLRVGENSSVELWDNRLTSTRVELFSGTAVIEADDQELSVKDTPVTLIYKNYEIHIVKHGVFEVSNSPSEMRVYKGEVLVTSGALSARVKEGRMLPFSAALETEKFNDKAGDELYLWTRDRSQSLSAASMSSARTLSTSSYSGSSSSWNGGWYFNPYFAMYTYVPASGAMFNSFGYGFYSPYSLSSFYNPTVYWYGGGGARGTGNVGLSLPGINSATTNRPAPLGTLRSGNTSFTSSVPALGNPVRQGGAIVAPDAGVASNGMISTGSASAPAVPSSAGAVALSSGGSVRGGGGSSAGGAGPVRGR